jgi:hypothetical protein
VAAVAMFLQPLQHLFAMEVFMLSSHLVSCKKTIDGLYLLILFFNI